MSKINREDFIIEINKIIDYEKKINNLDKALRDAFPSDFTGLADFVNIPLRINALAEKVGDKDDWISWWIYDTECGKNKDLARIWDGDIDDPNTICYHIYTSGDLYDFLLLNSIKAPTKEELDLVLKQQEEGVKFALQTIKDLIDTNTRTSNKKYKDRNTLLDFTYRKIVNDYIYATGIMHEPDPDDGVHLVCTLEEEDE